MAGRMVGLKEQLPGVRDGRMSGWSLGSQPGARGRRRGFEGFRRVCNVDRGESETF